MTVILSCLSINYREKSKQQESQEQEKSTHNTRKKMKEKIWLVTQFRYVNKRQTNGQ